MFASVPDVLRHCVRGFALYRARSDGSTRRTTRCRPGERRLLRSSQFVFSQHCKSCRTVGISEEKIAAIPTWSIASVFDEASVPCSPTPTPSSAPTAACPTSLFAELRAHLSDEEILELTYVTAMYEMHAIMSKALRVEFDDRDDPDRRDRRRCLVVGRRRRQDDQPRGCAR